MYVEEEVGILIMMMMNDDADRFDVHRRRSNDDDVVVVNISPPLFSNPFSSSTLHHNPPSSLLGGRRLHSAIMSSTKRFHYAFRIALVCRSDLISLLRPQSQPSSINTASSSTIPPTGLAPSSLSPVKAPPPIPQLDTSQVREYTLDTGLVCRAHYYMLPMDEPLYHSLADELCGGCVAVAVVVDGLEEAAEWNCILKNAGCKSKLIVAHETAVGGELREWAARNGWQVLAASTAGEGLLQEVFRRSAGAALGTDMGIVDASLLLGTAGTSLGDEYFAINSC
jgi:hypothetical protein